ncbi:hypothetical protein ABIB62_001559 [Mucilaginibacter sp. UYP25]|uniref:hypothetical protein n=1 Tax=unclassified Mucilaginibacter TaxID=2617802 RepID=UPI003391BDD0
MKKKLLPFPNIGEGQYLEDIIECIPSLIILFKMLTGIGATTLEIKYLSRNSIIIEANLPVIKGKCKKYNKGKNGKVILGVWEGVTVDTIIDYLKSDVKAKKILTTPESYYKVKQAFSELDIDIFAHSFMLWDECEKAVQDVGYRAKIILPIADFFQFQNKAFISATPIIPSDPTFVKQGFKHIYIKPDFDFKQKLKLIHTNNVHYTFKKFIEENPREQYFIFFSSTDSIAALILAMGILEESAVFCAKESKNKLRVNGFKHLSTDIATFQKFNFFTSRFFSAVDIEGIVNPTIIMITELAMASHTMIDPQSEAIQIVGRFRKEIGVKSVNEILHITNIDQQVSFKTEEACIAYINMWETIHGYLTSWYNGSTTSEGREVVKELMGFSFFKKYLNTDGTKNYFMQDNYVYEEKVKSYYQSIDALTASYNTGKHFNLNVITEVYEFSDWDRFKAGSAERLKTVFEVVMPKIKALYDMEDQLGFMWQFQLKDMQQEYPEVFVAFDKIGLDVAKELGFDHIKIRKAIKEKELVGQKTHFGFVNSIEDAFSEGEKCSSGTIVNRLRNCLTDNGLKLLTPGVKLLREYCQISSRTTIGRNAEGKEVKGYIILAIYNKK